MAGFPQPWERKYQARRQAFCVLQASPGHPPVTKSTVPDSRCFKAHHFCKIAFLSVLSFLLIFYAYITQNIFVYVPHALLWDQIHQHWGHTFFFFRFFAVLTLTNRESMNVHNTVRAQAEHSDDTDSVWHNFVTGTRLPQWRLHDRPVETFLLLMSLSLSIYI